MQEAKDLRWMAAATDRLPPGAPLFADQSKQAEVDAQHANGQSNGKSNGKQSTPGNGKAAGGNGKVTASAEKTTAAAS